MKGIVEIVFDPHKGKLRASFRGGWVRFPNELRTEAGVQYECELTEGKSGSWVAHKPIVQLDLTRGRAHEAPERKIVRERAAKGSMNKRIEKALDEMQSEFMRELKRIA